MLEWADRHGGINETGKLFLTFNQDACEEVIVCEGPFKVEVDEGY